MRKIEHDPKTNLAAIPGGAVMCKDARRVPEDDTVAGAAEPIAGLAGESEITP